MSGEYISPCGCKIHVAQWTAKRKVVSQESCSLHKAAAELRSALIAILPYREHNWDCESRMTEFCTCGMKQAADAARLILNQTAKTP